MGRLSQKVIVKTRQVVTVKRTLQFAGGGFALASVVAAMFLFGQNITQSTTVKAQYENRGDTLISSPNISRGDSLVKTTPSNPGIHSEDNNHLLVTKDLTTKKNKKKNTIVRTNDYHDFITLSPKLTNGVFEVNFSLSENHTNTTSIEILNRKGERVEWREASVINGVVNEVFSFDNSLTEGVYLIKIKIDDNLFIRQITYSRS